VKVKPRSVKHSSPISCLPVSPISSSSPPQSLPLSSSQSQPTMSFSSMDPLQDRVPEEGGGAVRDDRGGGGRLRAAARRWIQRCGGQRLVATAGWCSRSSSPPLSPTPVTSSQGAQPSFFWTAYRSRSISPIIYYEALVIPFLFPWLRSVLTEDYYVLLFLLCRPLSMSCSSREHTYSWDCDWFCLHNILGESRSRRYGKLVLLEVSSFFMFLTWQLVIRIWSAKYCDHLVRLYWYKHCACKDYLSQSTSFHFVNKIQIVPCMNKNQISWIGCCNTIQMYYALQKKILSFLYPPVWSK
jgi:hypothetical protein